MSLYESILGLHILSPVFPHGQDTSFFYISDAIPKVINELLNREMIPAIIVIQQQQQKQ